jgi:hypothetical protein
MSGPSLYPLQEFISFRILILKNIHMKYAILTLCTILVLGITSCDRDDDPIPTPNTTLGALRIEFENRFDTSAFEFGGSNVYTTDNGDSITFNTYKYYISNIQLIRPDGSSFNEPESYHLIDASDANSLAFTISNVPSGNYSGIRFMIGVDSTRNVSGSQTGALDPSNGMFWTWNTGYIMAKLEGNSPQSGASDGSIIYHIGGFSGVNSALRMVSPSFNGEQAEVSASVTPEVHIECDVAEWFRNPTVVNVGTTYFQMSVNSTSASIAANYSDMFSVDHIHN